MGGRIVRDPASPRQTTMSPPRPLPSRWRLTRRLPSMLRSFDGAGPAVDEDARAAVPEEPDRDGLRRAAPVDRRQPREHVLAEPPRRPLPDSLVPSSMPPQPNAGVTKRRTRVRQWRTPFHNRRRHDATHRPDRSRRALLTTAAAGSSATVFPTRSRCRTAGCRKGSLSRQEGRSMRLARERRRVRRKLANRRRRRVVPGQAGKVAVGVDYDRGRLFVAGGGTGDGFVYDAKSGATIAKYDFADPLTTATFVNDVIVTRTAAWFTESRSAVLYKVPLGPNGAPGPTFDVVSLTSPGSATPPPTPTASTPRRTVRRSSSSRAIPACCSRSTRRPGSPTRSS